MHRHTRNNAKHSLVVMSRYHEKLKLELWKEDTDKKVETGS